MSQKSQRSTFGEWRRQLLAWLPRFTGQSEEGGLDLQILEDRVLYSATPLPVDAAHNIDGNLDELDAALTAFLSEPTATDTGSNLAPVQQLEDDATSDAAGRKIFFIDSSLDELDLLLSQYSDDAETEVHVIEANVDGLQFITQILHNADEVFSSVHILTHGSEGMIQLGDTLLSQASLPGYESQLNSWADYLSEDADLLFYGCNVAGSLEGQLLLDTIAAWTAADVAASDNVTGHADLGGDWILEYTVGDVQAEVAFGYVVQASWYGTLDITTGLVGHWELDDGSGTIADDATANNNDGNVNGTATWTSGEIGGAFEFDPSNGEDYIEIPNSASLENVQENDYTLAAWFRPDSTPPGTGSDSDANYGILIKAGWHGGLYFGNDNRFHFDHVLTSNQAIGVASTNTFTPGQFYHVVGVVDRSAGTVSLYVNGQHEGTSNFTGGTAAREYGTEAWKLGVAIPGGGSWGWAADGAIDEARIYDRALTSSDVTELSRYGVIDLNDAPVQSSIEVAPLAYTENDPAVTITSTLTISDLDDTHIESAVMAITSNYVNGEDVLAFVDQNGISGAWNASTGELNLTGPATLADYQAALRSITYQNTSEGPSTATRTISFTVNDGDDNSNLQTRDIEVTAVNDAPEDLAATQSFFGGLSINHDGGNDVYLQADASPFSGQGQVTIEVDFQVTSPASGLTTLLSYATGTNQDELYVGIDSGGEVFFRTSSNGGSGYGSITHAPQLLDGNRHSLTVTWNSTGGILMFYVDGDRCRNRGQLPQRFAIRRTRHDRQLAFRSAFQRRSHHRCS